MACGDSSCLFFLEMQTIFFASSIRSVKRRLVNQSCLTLRLAALAALCLVAVVQEVRAQIPVIDDVVIMATAGGRNPVLDSSESIPSTTIAFPTVSGYNIPSIGIHKARDTRYDDSESGWTAVTPTLLTNSDANNFYISFPPFNSGGYFVFDPLFSSSGTRETTATYTLSHFRLSGPQNPPISRVFRMVAVGVPFMPSADDDVVIGPPYAVQEAVFPVGHAIDYQLSIRLNFSDRDRGYVERPHSAVLTSYAQTGLGVDSFTGLGVAGLAFASVGDGIQRGHLQGTATNVNLDGITVSGFYSVGGAYVKGVGTTEMRLRTVAPPVIPTDLIGLTYEFGELARHLFDAVDSVGTGNLTITLTGDALPDGVTFYPHRTGNLNGSNPPRSLRGTSTEIGVYNLTYVVTDNGFSSGPVEVSRPVRLVIQASKTASTDVITGDLLESQYDLTFTIGDPVAYTLPELYTESGNTFSVTSFGVVSGGVDLAEMALAGGSDIDFDLTTGIFSSPNVWQPGEFRQFILQAYNSGNPGPMITFTVDTDVELHTVNLVVNTPINTTLPLATSAGGGLPLHDLFGGENDDINRFTIFSSGEARYRRDYPAVQTNGITFDLGVGTFSGNAIAPQAATFTVRTWRRYSDGNEYARNWLNIAVNAAYGLPEFPAGTSPADQQIAENAKMPITPVTLGAAIAGTTPLGYRLSVGNVTFSADGVVNGLTYTAATGQISGSPYREGTMVMTYTVVDSASQTDAYTFTFDITAVAATFTTAQTDLGFTAKHTNTYTLQNAELGSGDFAYTLERTDGAAVPAALVFDSQQDVRTLRSTAQLTTAAAGTYLLLGDDESSLAVPATTFDITVAAELTFPADANPGEQYLGDNQFATITLGNADGGMATVGYTLTSGGATIAAGGELIAGLTYTAASGATDATLSGSPTTVGVTQLTYTATDPNGASDRFSMTINVVAQPTFAVPPRTELTFTVSQAGAFELPAAVGVAPISYVLLGAPNWLEITPTPAASASAVPFTFRLTGVDATVADAAITFLAIDAVTPPRTTTVAITAALVAVPAFDATPTNLTYTVGVDLDKETTEVTGGVALTYAVAPTLPNGLTLDTTNGNIGGTATAADVGAVYTMTVTDENGVGATSPEFGVRVYAMPAFAAAEADCRHTDVVCYGPYTFTAGKPETLRIVQPDADLGAPPLSFAFSFDAITAGLVVADGVVANAETGDLAVDFDVQLGAFPAAFGVTYQAIDANDAVVNAPTITFLILPPVTFTATDENALVGGYTFRRNLAAEITLPESAGGEAPIVHYLSAGTSPYDGAALDIPGMTFDQSSRIIKGAPTSAGRWASTLHARDNNGAIRSIAVNFDVLDVLTLQQYNLEYSTVQTSIAVTFAAARNAISPDVTYTLMDVDGGSPNLPGTLQFDGDSRSLFGNPGIAEYGPTTFVYRAVDSFDNATAAATFSLSVLSKPVFNPPRATVTYSPNSATYTAGGVLYPLLTLPRATGGSGALVYSVSGALPDGMSISDATVDAAVAVSGAPTAQSATTNSGDYVYYRFARDDDGEVATFRLNLHVAGAPRFVAQQPQLRTTIGAPVKTAQLPAAIGGLPPLSYSIADLPTNLEFVDSGQSGRALHYRAVSGEDTVGVHHYTMLVTDSNNATASLQFSLRIYPQLAFAGAQPGSMQSFTVGAPDKSIVFQPVNGGLAPYQYELEDISTVAVGNSLVFDSSTRTLRGTFAQTGGEYALTYIATEDNGATLSYGFSVIAVAPPEFADDAFDEWVFSLNAETTLPLPLASGGVAPLRYSIRGELPRGLVYDAAENEITGAPSELLANRNITVIATDANGAFVEHDISLTVVRAPVFAPSEILLSYTANQSYYLRDGVSTNATVTLPAASGGEGALVYQVIGGTPGGITPVDIGDNEFTLSGTPNAPPATTAFTYTRTATDEGGRGGTFMLIIVVAPEPTFGLQTISNEKYSADSIFAATLPAISGGIAPIVYTLVDSNGNGVPGLIFDADSRTLSGQIGSGAHVASYRYTAVDANNVAAPPLDFVFESVDATTVNFEPDVYEYTIDAAIPEGRETFTVTLAKPPSPASYEVLGNRPSGVSATFAVDDASTVHIEISGTPNRIGVYPLTFMVSEIGNPNVRQSGVFTVTIVDKPSFASGQYEYLVRVNRTDETNIDRRINTSFVLYPGAIARGDILDHLPKVRAGAGTITYEVMSPDIATLPEWIEVQQEGYENKEAIRVQALGEDLVDENAPEPVYAYTFVATDQSNVPTTALLMFSLSDGEADDYVAINEIILPEVSAAIISDAISAITERIAQLRVPIAAPRVSFGGQSSFAEMVATHGEAFADNQLDSKQLFSDARITLPISADGSPSLRTQRPPALAFWASGEYRKMFGDTPELEWDGDLTGIYIGIDGLISNHDIRGFDIYAGLALARAQTKLQYDDIGEQRTGGQGDYNLNITSAHPYISWQSGPHLDMWATVGYGEGNLTIERHDNTDVVSTDVSLANLAFGVSRLISQHDGNHIRLRGEMLTGRLDVNGNEDIVKQSVDTGLAKLAMVLSHPRDLRNGAHFDPVYLLGARYDYGDSESGGAMELSSAMRYTGANRRVSGVLRAHGVLSQSGEYKEWGVYAQLRNQPGLDKQGISASLTPIYGETEHQDLWQNTPTFTADPDDYALHWNARLGYGINALRDGTLTPFAELAHRTDNIYRLGLDWTPNNGVTFNLTGEQQSLDGAAQNSLLLQGKVGF